jgi:hypothetical protein
MNRTLHKQLIKYNFPQNQAGAPLRYLPTGMGLEFREMEQLLNQAANQLLKARPRLVDEIMKRVKS